MCKKKGESAGHLLLHWEIASALWNTIFSSEGLTWVMLRRVIDLFACWRALGGRFWLDVVWKMILPYIMWCLWCERNDWSFEDCERTLVDLKALFFKTLFHWRRVAGELSKMVAFLELASGSMVIAVGSSDGKKL
jgi:hypothetical protein